MRPEQLKLAEVQVNELVTEVASQIVRPGVHLETNFDPAVTPVKIDRALVGEALRNIIGNACEAMPNGGTLHLSTALNRMSGFVEISIADSGPGIAGEDLERIFNLYFTTKKNGNGLGLPLALRAIDLHDGTMDVRSEVGAGTTVVIRLPLAPETVEMSQAQPLSRIG
jgi:signal transduction histidine kinase